MADIELRPLCESDVDHILTWVNDIDVIGNIATLSPTTPFTKADELAYVRKMTASPSDLVFSIWADDEYLGQVGLHQIWRRSRTGRMAVVIGSKENMGKGYGTKAIRALLDMAFINHNLHKIWLLVFRKNTRSIRTYQRIGFIQEGILREEYYHEGRYHDMVRMSVLASEWTTKGTNHAKNDTRDRAEGEQTSVGAV